MRRKLLPLLLAVGLVASITACGGGQDSPSGDPTNVGPGSGKTVRWATSAMPTSFDPATAANSAYAVFMWLIYDRLIYADPNGSLKPMLATKWTLAEDALSLDLTLREGVTFQDGTPLDAEAVVANMEHMMGEGSLVASSLRMIDKVEVVDAQHVRFLLNRPGGDLPQVLSGFAGMMVSPASLDAGTTGTDPVGAGPYTVSSISDARVTFEFWDGYWDAENIVPQGVEVSVLTDDTARLNALKSGQVDAAIIRPNQLIEAEAAGLQTYRVSSPTAYGIQVNAAHPVLANPDVRRAISAAIDRESIKDFLYDGECEISAQPYPASYWAYSDDIDDSKYIKYDPEAARAAIAAAAPGGLSLTIITPNVTAYQRLSEVLQEQLGEIGIEVKVEPIDYADLLARGRSGDFDLIVTLLLSSSPDPSTWAEQNYRISATAPQYIDPRLPELIEASRRSVDLEERGAAIGQVTKAALDAGTNQIVVCLPSNTFAAGANVTGFEVNNPRHMNVG
jgi:peptide/nickel transport system substrate-binding protein